MFHKKLMVVRAVLDEIYIDIIFNAITYDSLECTNNEPH